MSVGPSTLIAPSGLVSQTLHGLSQIYQVDANGYVVNVAAVDVPKLLVQGFTTAPAVGEVLLGVLKGANFNVTTDQVITLSTAGLGSVTAKVYPNRIVVDNASTSLTTAVGGIYTAASKGGTAIVANSQAYSALTAAGQALELTLAAKPVVVPPATYYLSLTTAQGAAATADVYVFGSILP